MKDKKFNIRCKNCEHHEAVGKWIYCKKGMGTFSKMVAFIECSEYQKKGKPLKEKKNEKKI